VADISPTFAPMFAGSIDVPKWPHERQVPEMTPTPKQVFTLDDLEASDNAFAQIEMPNYLQKVTSSCVADCPQCGREIVVCHTQIPDLLITFDVHLPHAIDCHERNGRPAKANNMQVPVLPVLVYHVCQPNEMLAHYNTIGAEKKANVTPKSTVDGLLQRLLGGESKGGVN
jgi:hypothetical protein